MQQRESTLSQELGEHATAITMLLVAAWSRDSARWHSRWVHMHLLLPCCWLQREQRQCTLSQELGAHAPAVTMLLVAAWRAETGVALTTGWVCTCCALLVAAWGMDWVRSHSRWMSMHLLSRCWLQRAAEREHAFTGAG